eukprot:GHVQ01027483.1.p2 GENE.GHVQ01027483.1~~GHVQ01027483.1.p2  ORF type:complete len:246 (-),score=36.46 GHVQ01027483.1:920-1657(-)
MEESEQRCVSLKDVLEPQRRHSRLLLLSTVPAKQQSEVQESFIEYLSEADKEQDITGLMLFTGGFCLHMLEGNNSKLFEALAFLSKSEEAPQPALNLVSSLMVLHFTEWRSVRLLPYWTSVGFTGKTNHHTGGGGGNSGKYYHEDKEDAAEITATVESIWSIYKSIILLCTKLSKVEKCYASSWIKQNYPRDAVVPVNLLRDIVSQNCNNQQLWSAKGLTEFFTGSPKLVLRSEQTWPAQLSLIY